MCRGSRSGGGGDESDLTDSLGAVRPFRLCLLDEDALDGGHPLGRDDALRFERWSLDVSAVDNELLGKCVPEPHMYGTLELTLEQITVHDSPDVVCCDDLGDPPIIVEDNDLRTPPEADMRALDVLGVHRLRHPELDLADEFAPGKLGQLRAVEFGSQRIAGPLDREA